MEIASFHPSGAQKFKIKITHACFNEKFVSPFVLYFILSLVTVDKF
jgi:hypothetical protein